MKTIYLTNDNDIELFNFSTLKLYVWSQQNSYVRIDTSLHLSPDQITFHQIYHVSPDDRRNNIFLVPYYIAEELIVGQIIS